MLKTNKKVLFIYLLILIFYGINCYIFFSNINSEGYLFLADVNRFSFWNFSFHDGIATIIMFLLPILICFISLLDFSKKTKGSYLKSYLMRKEYKIYFVTELCKAYLKALIPFVFCSIFIFLIGCILFKGEITNIQYADLFSGFTYNKVYSPYYHVLISHLLLILFIAFIMNMALIIYRLVKRYSITMILTFIGLNILNYIISALFTFSSYFVDPYMNKYMENFNIYHGYLGGYYINFNLIILIILFLTSFIIVIMLYRNKEKVVMDFEY